MGVLISLQVSNQLNRLYMKFLRRNPGYDGKVCTSKIILPLSSVKFRYTNGIFLYML